MQQKRKPTYDSKSSNTNGSPADENKPVAETACTANGDYRHVPRDTTRVINHGLCEMCFPDGEVPSHIYWLLDATHGQLHKSTDDGDAELNGRGKTGSGLVAKLSDPDATEFDDLRGDQ